MARSANVRAHDAASPQGLVQRVFVAVRAGVRAEPAPACARQRLKHGVLQVDRKRRIQQAHAKSPWPYALHPGHPDFASEPRLFEGWQQGVDAVFMDIHPGVVTQRTVHRGRGQVPHKAGLLLFGAKKAKSCPK